MQKFWSLCLPSRGETKDDVRQLQTVHFTSVDNSLSAAAGSSLQLVMPNEIVGHYCIGHPLNFPPPICLVCPW